jgi:hypothetical protein
MRTRIEIESMLQHVILFPDKLTSVRILLNCTVRTYKFIREDLAMNSHTNAVGNLGKRTTSRDREGLAALPCALRSAKKMRVVRYKQSEFLQPWKWRRKKPLHLFIFEIPYALYFSIVPGREALNDVLRQGSGGGGMGTGVYWEPLELSDSEYTEVTEAWLSVDLRKILGFRKKHRINLDFIFDDEILTIRQHLQYLERSREKYEDHFWKPLAEHGGDGKPDPVSS